MLTLQVRIPFPTTPSISFLRHILPRTTLPVKISLSSQKRVRRKDVKEEVARP